MLSSGEFFRGVAYLLRYRIVLLDVTVFSLTSAAGQVSVRGPPKIGVLRLNPVLEPHVYMLDPDSDQCRLEVSDPEVFRLPASLI